MGGRPLFQVQKLALAVFFWSESQFQSRTHIPALPHYHFITNFTANIMVPFEPSASIHKLLLW